MSEVKFEIDVRGLNLDQKRQIWKHYWQPDPGMNHPVDVSNIEERDTIITVYKPGSCYRGNIARDGGTRIHDESRYKYCWKPKFKIIHEFLGIDEPVINLNGKMYRLVEINDADDGEFEQ